MRPFVRFSDEVSRLNFEPSNLRTAESLAVGLSKDGQWNNTQNGVPLTARNRVQLKVESRSSPLKNGRVLYHKKVKNQTADEFRRSGFLNL